MVNVANSTHVHVGLGTLEFFFAIFSTPKKPNANEVSAQPSNTEAPKELVPMGRIELPTSPLPRECSTTEPHGHKPAFQQTYTNYWSGRRNRTRVISLKARVLPLNYSRKPCVCAHLLRCKIFNHPKDGGEDWIRTSVGVSQQIYSLPPLATQAPLREDLNCSTIFSLKNTATYFS